MSNNDSCPSACTAVALSNGDRLLRGACSKAASDCSDLLFIAAKAVWRRAAVCGSFTCGNNSVSASCNALLIALWICSHTACLSSVKRAKQCAYKIALCASTKLNALTNSAAPLCASSLDKAVKSSVQRAAGTYAEMLNNGASVHAVSMPKPIRPCSHVMGDTSLCRADKFWSVCSYNAAPDTSPAVFPKTARAILADCCTSVRSSRCQCCNASI